MNLLRLKTLRDNTNQYRLIGDVDLDGLVTDRDVQLMFDAMNGKVQLNEIQFKNADVDGDGIITIKDIEKINNWLIGGDNYVIRWIKVDEPNPQIPNYPLTFHDYRFPQAAILDENGIPYYQSDKQYVIENDVIVEKPYSKYEQPIDPEPVDLPEQYIEQPAEEIVMNTNILPTITEIIQDNETNQIDIPITNVTKKGDIDGDGKVTPYDASLILQYLNGNIELTKEQLTAADVDEDGIVTQNDAQSILNYVTTGDWNINKKIEGTTTMLPRAPEPEDDLTSIYPINETGYPVEDTNQPYDYDNIGSETSALIPNVDWKYPTQTQTVAAPIQLNETNKQKEQSFFEQNKIVLTYLGFLTGLWLIFKK